MARGRCAFTSDSFREAYAIKKREWYVYLVRIVCMRCGGSRRTARRPPLGRITAALSRRQDHGATITAPRSRRGCAAARLLDDLLQQVRFEERHKNNHEGYAHNEEENRHVKSSVQGRLRAPSLDHKPRLATPLERAGVSFTIWKGAPTACSRGIQTRHRAERQI